MGRYLRNVVCVKHDAPLKGYRTRYRIVIEPCVVCEAEADLRVAQERNKQATEFTEQLKDILRPLRNLQSSKG